MPSSAATATETRPPRRRGVLLLVLACALSPCLLPGRAPAGDAHPERALEFIYIDSAVDESAGGHAALRLGETVFHYQYYPGGLFLLDKDPWVDFRFLYGELGNRSFTLTRVPLSDRAYDTLRSRLIADYLLQERGLALLDRMVEARDFLSRRAAGEDAAPVEGLGLFAEAGPRDTHARELLATVEERWGREQLPRALATVTAALNRLPPPVSPAPPEAETTDAVARTAGWGVRVRELLSFREALRTLLDARPLAAGTLLRVEEADVLSPEETEGLREFRRALVDSIVALLRADRPGRGAALLLQAARYQAVSRSLEAGVLLTLDPFSERAERRSPEAAPPGERRLVRREQEPAAARAELLRLFLRDPEQRAVVYGRIEAVQGRLFELEQFGRGTATVRVEEGHLVPRRSRTVRIGLPGDPGEFAAAARVAAAAAARQRREIARSHRFNLFTRNCATEVSRRVNESFESTEQAAAELGGAPAPEAGLSFIPFQWSRLIRESRSGGDTRFLPSYRRRELARLVSEEGRGVWLRESNTLTSTIYTPSWDRDSVFLFFTDDVLAARPLLGALNLVYAGAHAAGGALIAPADHGRHLLNSLRGVLYSIPELAFFNIRKGSFRALAD